MAGAGRPGTVFRLRSGEESVGVLAEAEEDVELEER